MDNLQREGLSAFYTWAPYPYTNEEGEMVKDNTWERLYKHISVVNVILKKSEGIHDFPEEIERIQGEWLLPACGVLLLSGKFLCKTLRESNG